ncbi:MAG: TIR domain-containing protein [Bryobacteraceae bacterium]
MAFVPGFDHDVFVSYAHGDDRDWIHRFVDRLELALRRRLPGASVWIDKDDLRKSRNFEREIPWRGAQRNFRSDCSRRGTPSGHHGVPKKLTTSRD